MPAMATDGTSPTLKILLIGPSGAGKSARMFAWFFLAPVDRLESEVPDKQKKS